MLGIQFDELFENDLYLELGRHANRLAMKIKRAFVEKGYELYEDCYTNQQFFLVTEKELARISEKVAVDDWGPVAEGKHVIRIATSWATTEEAVDLLISAL
jgi:threonine aldolase